MKKRWINPRIFARENKTKLKQTFTKEERLHEKKLIERLFKDGKSFFTFPFQVFFSPLKTTSRYPARVLISVPKRNFKRAVDRNRIKRLVREAYRRNKYILCPPGKKAGCTHPLLIGLIYTAKVHTDYVEVERKIILILQQLFEKNEQVTE
ncbi:MAG: ribonuclease P protein component [bacterium]|nr:MAG: ribonuclease P protein component [bacterium]